MMITDNIDMMTFLSFLQGFMASGRCTVSYVYMTEFLSSFWIPIACGASGTIDAFILVAISAYFDFISKNYIYVCSLGFFTAIIALISIQLVFPESPLWLIKSGNIKMA